MRGRVAVDDLPGGLDAGVQGPGLAKVAGQDVVRDGQTLAGKVAQRLVVKRGAGKFGFEFRGQVGRWAWGFSMARLRLPTAYSISRYCQDWKPDDWPSFSRKVV
jgi:hypothetical protein